MKVINMKLKKIPTMLSLMALAVMTSSLALADENSNDYDSPQFDSGWYLGGNIGQAHASIDDKRITNRLLNNGLATSAIKDDERDFGYKMFGGYQFNKNFSLEGGYFDLGDFSFTAATLPAGMLNGKIKVRGLNFDVVGFLPITEKLSAFARVGLNYAETKDSFSGTGAVSVAKSSAKERQLNPKVGVGLQYAFTEAFAMRVEAERYRINDAVGSKGDVDLVSLGVVYRFGKAKAAPVVVAPTPAPAPVVVLPPPPPPAPHFEKYTLSATELFGFDSSLVNLPQVKLEQITTAIKGEGSPKHIVIQGFTDRLGSDVYNQKLSERRALAVKEYMVNRGVDADRLIAEGKGESDPIVVCTDKNKAALIECLKPNRRVEIDEVKIVHEIKSK